MPRCPKPQKESETQRGEKIGNQKNYPGCGRRREMLWKRKSFSEGPVLLKKLGWTVDEAGSGTLGARANDF